MSQKFSLKHTMSVLFLFASLLVGLFVYQHIQPKAKPFNPDSLHGTFVPSGRGLPAFEFTDTNGKTLHPSDLVGHWSLLFFGYTQCHSICPATMAKLHELNTILHQSYAINPPVQVYMFSLDPSRDTLTSLGQYVHGFDKEFLGALGNTAMVNQFTQHLGIVYDAQPKADGQIDHSGAITVINPRGEVAEFFTPPLDAKWMAEDLAELSQQFDIR